MATLQSNYDYTTRFKNGFLKITLADKQMAEVIEPLLNEFDKIDFKTFYQSKYNAYVKYDYEPFCVDGFNIEFEITDKLGDGVFVSNQLKFIEYVAVKRLERYVELEKQKDLDIDMRSTEGKLIKRLMEV